MTSSNWFERVREVLALYGHRNWIVVADAAYPVQSRAGIETVVAEADQLAALQAVLAAIDAAPHVRPVVHLDAELPCVAEADAPGVTPYRTALADLLANYRIASLPHEAIIAKLDDAGAIFRMLIVKTTMTIPYTSVFLQLECGYWSPEAEKRLRTAMDL